MSNKLYGEGILGTVNGVVAVNNELTGAYQINVNQKIIELAYEEYSRRFKSQSLERIQERGGFSVFELLTLLADHITELKERS